MAVSKLLIDGDIIAYQIASQIEEPVDWGGDQWTLHSDFKTAKSMFENYLLTLKENLYLSDTLIFLSDRKQNFRKTLLDDYNNTLSKYNNKIESITEEEENKMTSSFNEWCLKNMFDSNYEINLIPTHLHQPNIEYKINPDSGKPHREFTKGKDYGNPHYNVLAYLQISNCSNLSKAGTGLIYPTSTGECKIKILPIIPGMVIAIRDQCFYHFTPPAISFIDREICMRRTLFRCFIDKIGDTIEPDIDNLKKCLEHYTYLDDEEEPVIKSEFIKELQ